MSCTNVKQKNDSELIDISFEKMSTINPMDVLNTSFIKLETTDSCLISSVGILVSVDNYLLVLDGRSSELYAFDKEGKFETKVGRKGNGPGEYVSVQNIFVDNRKGQIGVIDTEQDKIVYFSIPDFKFSSEKKLPFNTSCCEMLEDGNFVCYSESYEDNDLGNHYFIVVDSLYKPIRETVEKKFKSGYQTGASTMVYKVDDKVLAYSPFVSDVYEINTNETKCLYRLSFGDYEMPSHDFLMEKSNGGKNNYFNALENSNYISYYDINETSNYMFVFYIVNNQKHIGVYDKEHKKTYAYKLEFFQDKLGVGDAFSYCAGMIYDCCTVPLDTNDLIDLKEGGYELPIGLLKLVNESKYDDNPILLMVDLK